MFRDPLPPISFKHLSVKLRATHSSARNRTYLRVTSNRCTGYKSVAHYLVLNHLEGPEEAAAGEPPSPSAAVADGEAAAADAAPAPATPPREGAP